MLVQAGGQSYLIDAGRAEETDLASDCGLMGRTGLLSIVPTHVMQHIDSLYAGSL
ncbi:MAG: hypothetical protein ACRDTR_05035 [Rubrobacter sp.]